MPSFLKTIENVNAKYGYFLNKNQKIEYPITGTEKFLNVWLQHAQRSDSEIELGSVEHNKDNIKKNHDHTIVIALFKYSLGSYFTSSTHYTELHKTLKNECHEGYLVDKEEQEDFLNQLAQSFNAYDNSDAPIYLEQLLLTWDLCDTLFTSFEDLHRKQAKIKIFGKFATSRLFTWLEKMAEEPLNRTSDRKPLPADDFKKILDRIPSELILEFYNQEMHFTLAENVMSHYKDNKDNSAAFDGNEIKGSLVKYKMFIDKIIESKLSSGTIVTTNDSLMQFESFYEDCEELREYLNEKISNDTIAKNMDNDAKLRLEAYLTFFQEICEGIVISDTPGIFTTDVKLSIPYIKQNKKLNESYWQFITVEIIVALFNASSYITCNNRCNLIDYYELDKAARTLDKKSIFYRASLNVPGILETRFIQKLKDNLVLMLNYDFTRKFAFYRDVNHAINRFIIFNKNILYIFKSFNLPDAEYAYYLSPSITNWVTIISLFADEKQKKLLSELGLYRKTAPANLLKLNEAIPSQSGNTAFLVTQIQTIANNYQARYSFTKEERKNYLSILILSTMNDKPIVAATKIILALMDYGNEDFLSGNLTNILGTQINSDFANHKVFFIAQINLSLRKITYKNRQSPRAKQTCEYLSKFMTVLDIKNSDLDEYAQVIIKIHTSEPVVQSSLSSSSSSSSTTTLPCSKKT